MFHRGNVSTMTTQSHMYANAKTWNPFKGCDYDCIYCKASFQLQAKRQRKNCIYCYEYTPHCHFARFSEIPKAGIVFVCGNGDIAFSCRWCVREILKAIKKDSRRKPEKIFYLQTKKPVYLSQFLADIPNNVICVTTLETNRDAGYEAISKAPRPSVRYSQFKQLEYPRKVVTIEPVMDFDLDVFSDWIITLRPEYVWLGFNSRPAQVKLPEPSAEKLQLFTRNLLAAGVAVRGKKLRGIPMTGVLRFQD